VRRRLCCRLKRRSVSVSRKQHGELRLPRGCESPLNSNAERYYWQGLNLGRRNGVAVVSPTGNWRAQPCEWIHTRARLRLANVAVLARESRA
jgi:hypothetical protein